MTFKALHRRGDPLVLPNAWDAVSARLFEMAGFPAVATTSAGVAYALGYADGEQVDVDEMIAAIRRIVRSVRVFVTADVEAGYGGSIDDLLAIMERVRATGVVGVNVEDWDVRTGAPFPLDTARARIAAIKDRFGDALFLNARTDLYLQEVGDPATRFDAVVERLRAFVDAGADGVFVPGVSDGATIARLAGAVDAPLNILAGTATPAVAELAALRVGRVSVGSWPIRRVMGEVRAIAAELAEKGTFEFTRDAHTIPYAEMNALFSRSTSG
ncbi:MAG TPA: isocitrate lyase/phosphoenolpyruvate mutase family protein [Candidatus Acidoferrum sp.]|nr:isocitrate lyase/phosphoenolpyruvate mutase family protein [Candidatus Acidoferrum sp.]